MAGSGLILIRYIMQIIEHKLFSLLPPAGGEGEEQPAGRFLLLLSVMAVQ
jgi:hypothetical protein